MTTTKPKDGDLQVWHIPQVPSQPFTVPVETPQQGWLVMTILANLCPPGPAHGGAAGAREGRRNK